jgi:hypothetical protein
VVARLGAEEEATTGRWPGRSCTPSEGSAPSAEDSRPAEGQRTTVRRCWRCPPERGRTGAVSSAGRASRRAPGFKARRGGAAQLQGRTGAAVAGASSRLVAAGGVGRGRACRGAHGAGLGRAARPVGLAWRGRPGVVGRTVTVARAEQRWARGIGSGGSG